MALIVITVADGPDGVNVSLQSEPGFNPADGETELSGAQVAALNMLNALKSEPLKEDRGLIQLLS